MQFQPVLDIAQAHRPVPLTILCILRPPLCIHTKVLNKKNWKQWRKTRTRSLSETSSTSHFMGGVGTKAEQGWIGVGGRERESRSVGSPAWERGRYDLVNLCQMQTPIPCLGLSDLHQRFRQHKSKYRYWN